MTTELFFVFDVESIGLHGEGFSAGWVVVNRLGREIEHGEAVCPDGAAMGDGEDRLWVINNCPLSPAPDCHTPNQVRTKFWNAWMKWKEKGAVMAADCSWPVEARFLNLCVDDAPSSRKWSGPYPFIDIGSVLFAKGVDPLTTFDRKENELPKHNPVCDARQSARIMIETLWGMHE